jgi:NitT/TauT family transport system ATP-binding protein
VSDLELRGVEMEFDGRQPVRALDPVSLRVPSGRFACMVGPSGCGKSTLLTVAAGLLAPTRGQVLVDGRPTTGPGAERGMVFQSYSLYPWRSVRRNVEFGLEIRGMPAGERRQISAELIALMRLEGFVDAYPNALSGGMRQRVAIARALANDPQVLLMDEPFGALDAQTRQLMQELLTDTWQRFRKTVLFVTHDIDEAIFLGDVIHVMTARPGRIRQVIPVELERPRTFETLASPRFRELRRQVIEVSRQESLKALESELGHR